MSTLWNPPRKVEELYEATSSNRFSGINRPTAGARFEQQLPKGIKNIQLYSLATPNGQKVSNLLEELIEAGADAQYDAHFIDISKGEQFSSGFYEMNPNSRIPACLIREDNHWISLFESGSINLYLCERYKCFIPTETHLRAQVMNWVFWQMGNQGPMSGQFGHFFVYAPDEQSQARIYGSARYGMEVQRQCDILDKYLADRNFLVGESYTLADIMVYPWVAQLQNGYNHPSGVSAKEFLSIESYKSLWAWSERIASRPAIARGMKVCSSRSL